MSQHTFTSKKHVVSWSTCHLCSNVILPASCFHSFGSVGNSPTWSTWKSLKWKKSPLFLGNMLFFFSSNMKVDPFWITSKGEGVNPWKIHRQCTLSHLGFTIHLLKRSDLHPPKKDLRESGSWIYPRRSVDKGYLFKASSLWIYPTDLMQPSPKTCPRCAPVYEYPDLLKSCPAIYPWNS